MSVEWKRTRHHVKKSYHHGLKRGLLGLNPFEQSLYDWHEIEDGGCDLKGCIVVERRRGFDRFGRGLDLSSDDEGLLLDLDGC
ncbi:hypothetical protein AC578_5482 [Pseudocercospora eumusae]|uniref:Uncharacterized protein n=1 Tax=Pseudocercospora eumusae TaxID=321146 RepID=A0A139H1A2_9PEZI|nr:hypothetical protein AC578_5482 [Pseudocercospora eumusae]